jgi:cytochrome c553
LFLPVTGYQYIQNKTENMKKILSILSLVITIGVIINACKHEPPMIAIDATPIPGPVANNGVCFQNDILPLLQSNCAKSGCHDAASRQGEYILDSYSNILKKGISPGNATGSKIYKVLFETGNDKMPQPPNPDLTAEQKAIIGKWINEGAKNTTNCGTTCDSTQFKYAANISPLISTNCLGCHAGTSPSGGVNLSAYIAVKQQATSGRLVGAVSHSPGYSAMPSGASKLSECQIAQIRKWVNAGALNN